MHGCRRLLADHDRAVDRTGHLIFKHRFYTAAEHGDTFFRLAQLYVCKLTFHGDERAADLHIRKAKLRQNVQPRDGARDGNVKAFAAGRSRFDRGHRP